MRQAEENAAWFTSENDRNVFCLTELHGVAVSDIYVGCGGQAICSTFRIMLIIPAFAGYLMHGSQLQGCKLDKLAELLLLDPQTKQHIVSRASAHVRRASSSVQKRI